MLIYLAASLLLDSVQANSDSSLPRYLLRARQVRADQVAALAYYVGLPFGAVLAGAADFPVHLGLAGMDWPASLARGAALGLAIFLGMAGIAGYVQRHTPEARCEGLAGEWEPWFLALCREAHWAFYRLPGILLMGDFLWGTFIGAALALLERAGDPRWLRAATAPRTALAVWLDVALLVGMSVAFYLVRNFFVLWAVHAVLIWAGRKAFR